MYRRIHTSVLFVGKIPLDEAEAHHVRDVMRLPIGAVVEVFDDRGNIANGILTAGGPSKLSVRVDLIQATPDQRISIVVAAAVPKGERADWMVEKLSELGVDIFIPIAAKHSVVIPRGQNKLERWKRIAIESAKQCRRPGVMKIEKIVPIATAIKSAENSGWFFSTVPETPGISDAVATLNGIQRLTMFIGPEGGWSDDELLLFEQFGLTAVSLGPTILRVETAAVASAAIAQALLHRSVP